MYVGARQFYHSTRFTVVPGRPVSRRPAALAGGGTILASVVRRSQETYSTVSYYVYERYSRHTSVLYYRAVLWSLTTYPEQSPYITYTVRYGYASRYGLRYLHTLSLRCDSCSKRGSRFHRALIDHHRSLPLCGCDGAGSVACRNVRRVECRLCARRRCSAPAFLVGQTATTDLVMSERTMANGARQTFSQTWYRCERMRVLVQERLLRTRMTRMSCTSQPCASEMPRDSK